MNISCTAKWRGRKYKTEAILALLAMQAFSTLSAYSTGSALYAQDCNVEISTMHTSHIIFATDLTYVDISSKVIAAKIVDSSKNILALKAKEPFDFTTTVSILEANGQLHTFYVTYAEKPGLLIHDIRKSGEEVTIAPPADTVVQRTTPQPSTRAGGRRNRGGKEDQASVSSTRRSNAPALSEIASRRQGIFHVADRKYGLLAMVENIYVYSDITYISLSVNNTTGISFESTDARFVVETKKRSKRGLDVDKTLYAKSRYGTLIVPAGETVKVVYSFNKVTLAKDQVLRVYLYEQNGSRNLCMTLNHNDLNNARAAK